MVVPVLVALGKGRPFSAKKLFLDTIKTRYRESKQYRYRKVLEKSKPGGENTEVMVVAARVRVARVTHVC
jgi:hypothetical protein